MTRTRVPNRERSSACWMLLTCLLFCLASATIGGTRVSFAGGGGGGIGPAPPNFAPPPVGNFTPSNNQLLRLPLVVIVDGAEPSYAIAVTTSAGQVVATGVTNAQGVVVLGVPAAGDLELDVLGTGVVGVPVQAGEVVTIVIP